WHRGVCCFSSSRRHTRSKRDWSSDVCSSDLKIMLERARANPQIKWELNKTVEKVLEVDGKVGGLELKDTITGETTTKDYTAMFVAIGHDPRSEFLEGQVAT